MLKLTRICEFNGLVKLGISLVSTKNPSYCIVFVLSRVLDATDLKPEADVMMKWWDDKAGSLAHTIFILGCPGQGRDHWAMIPPQESKFYFRHRTKLEKSPRMMIDSPQNRVWPLQTISKYPPGPQSFTGLSSEHRVQSTRLLYVTCHRQAAEFLLMKVNFEKSWAPRTFSAAGLAFYHQTT